MKCKVIFVLYLTVLNVQSEIKEDDDRWSWGLVNETTTTKTENRNNGNDSTSTTVTSTTTPRSITSIVNVSACEFPLPSKPSFSAPGRRISEEKCEEYKWSKKVKEEQEQKVDECIEEQFKNGILFPPQAVGGRPTFLGEFPHMGAIGWAAVIGGYIFKCGSTLISPKFVLTAAHCSRVSSIDTTVLDVVPKIIRLNDKNLFQKDDKGKVFTKDVNITRIIVHPDYKAPKKYFDIALMELQHEITFTFRVQPACLWTKADVSELGSDATLTGWGVLKPGSIDISPELQAADVDIINNTYCDELLFRVRNRNFQGVKDHQLCAGKLAGGVDACQGDSGGPLQVKRKVEETSNQYVYHVIGVTSFGIGCALPNLPGIYTRVSSFIDWIEGHVWP